MEKNAKKDFLLIVNSFPPAVNQNSIRALEISKNITKDQFNPIILTRRITTTEPQNQHLLKEVPKNVKAFRTPILEVKKRKSITYYLAKIINFGIEHFQYFELSPAVTLKVKLTTLGLDFFHAGDFSYL